MEKVHILTFFFLKGGSSAPKTRLVYWGIFFPIVNLFFGELVSGFNRPHRCFFVSTPKAYTPLIFSTKFFGNLMPRKNNNDAHWDWTQWPSRRYSLYLRKA